jgi:hypothetical protein
MFSDRLIVPLIRDGVNSKISKSVIFLYNRFFCVLVRVAWYSHDVN